MTTLFGSSENVPKPRHSLLPLLTIVFMVSYGLMTLLIVEQGSTIQSQRSLIRQLLGDSTELSALKGKMVHDQAAVRDPKVQAPSTQAVPPEKPRSEHPASKARRPERPPKAASDLVDVRRNLISI